MSLKKIKYINIIVLFLLMSLTHNLYKWFPNDLFALLFPVNESIWEHMKMIYSTIILYSVFEFYLLNKFKIDVNNFLFSIYVSSIVTIISTLLIFVPIYNIIGENLPVTLIILFICISIGQVISYHIKNMSEIKNINIISIILIIITFIIMGILTYNPPINSLFFDEKKQIYGINTYVI